MRSVEFHPEAAAEFVSAARYYEDHAANLGLEFVSAVQGTHQRVLEFPESGRPFGRRLRRILVPGFPYALLYRVETQRVLIVAVAHLHRRPGFWRSRS